MRGSKVLPNKMLDYPVMMVFENGRPVFTFNGTVEMVSAKYCMPSVSCLLVVPCAASWYLVVRRAVCRVPCAVWHVIPWCGVTCTLSLARCLCPLPLATNIYQMLKQRRCVANPLTSARTRAALHPIVACVTGEWPSVGQRHHRCRAAGSLWHAKGAGPAG